jgi:hypothetical protein
MVLNVSLDVSFDDSDGMKYWTYERKLIVRGRAIAQAVRR